MKRNEMKVKQHGLTLMELLIIIGIILTLTSLTLSVVRLGISAAQRIQCINNLRQIYEATKLYEEEFGSPPILAKHFVSWNPELEQIMICPSDPYQGYGDIARYISRYGEEAKNRFSIVPFSYEPIYWTWYWMLKIKPKFGRFGEESDWWREDWQKTINAIQQRINKPNMPVVICPFHNLAIFRDGNVGKSPPPIILD